MLDTLADRSLDGYPGITVKLETCNKFTKLLVTVQDGDGEHVIYKGTDKQAASNAYFHPFVYGYDLPVRFEVEVA